MKKTELSNTPHESKRYDDVRSIIEDARFRVAVHVNSKACLINRHVGTRIKEDVLDNERAEYGKQILKNPAKRMTIRYS